MNFRDERYLPFEGAGVISQWKLELNGKFKDEEKNRIIDISQFDCNSISDIIIQFRYTAREDAGKFRKDVMRIWKNSSKINLIMKKGLL